MLKTSEHTSARSAWFLLGFISIASQVILLRAAIAIFSGNELIIGPSLFSWTMWIAVGSLMGAKLSGARGRPMMRAGIGAAMIALPATYFAVLAAKAILGESPAVSIDPIRSFAFLLVAFAPLCVILGISFSIGCRIAEDTGGRAVASTYLWDSLGAAAGGLIFSEIVLPFLPASRSIFLMISIVSLFLAIDAFRETGRIGKGAAAWTALFCLASVFIFWNKPADKINEVVWRGYPIIEEKDSRYSHLMLVRNRNEYTLFSNGTPMFSYPGGPADETLAYLALASNPGAKRALLVGGGFSVAGAKLRDGKIELLDYCQLDPAAIAMERRIPTAINPDLRLRTHAEDGRQFIRNAAPGSFDIVALDIGDPDTLSQNRYYTIEFFERVKTALKSDGIFIFGLGEYANYISEKQGLFISSIHKPLAAVFPNVEIFPLDRFYLLATDKGSLPKNADAVIRNMEIAGLRGDYFRPEKIKFDLTEERIKQCKNAVARHNPGMNRDLFPVGFSMKSAAWLSQFDETKSTSLNKLFGAPPPMLWMPILSLVILTFLFFGKKLSAAGRLEYSVIFGAGFFGMAVEICVLYCVQIRLGAFYGYVGLIITLYMAASGIGAWLSCLSSESIRLKVTQLLFAATVFYSIFSVCFVKYFLDEAGNFLCLLTLSIHVVLAAAMAGNIFGAAARNRETSQSDAGKLGGRLNFADLAGGGAACLFVPLLMLPLWGYLLTNLVAFSILIASCFSWIVMLDKTKKTSS